MSFVSKFGFVALVLGG